MVGRVRQQLTASGSGLRDAVSEGASSSVGSHAFFYTSSDSWDGKCHELLSDDSFVGSRVSRSNEKVSDADLVNQRAVERAVILKELEQLPDETLISTRQAGAYLDLDPRNVALLYHDKLVDGVKSKGPKGRIKIRLGSLRRMSGTMKKVRK